MSKRKKRLDEILSSDMMLELVKNGYLIIDNESITTFRVQTSIARGAIARKSPEEIESGRKQHEEAMRCALLSQIPIQYMERKYDRVNGESIIFMECKVIAPGVPRGEKVN